MTATKKKSRRPSLRKLRDKAWDLTSKYVRMSAANENGYASCVTCGVTKPWGQLQAGHFVPQARGNAVRFDLRNCHPQCPRCNIFLYGNLLEYYPYMVRRYGEDVVAELKALSGITVKYTRSDYEGMIEDLSGRLAELAAGYVEENTGTRWALMNVS